MPSFHQLLISTSVASVVALAVFGFLYLIGYKEDSVLFATIAGAVSASTITISQMEETAQAERSSGEPWE